MESEKVENSLVVTKTQTELPLKALSTEEE